MSRPETDRLADDYGSEIIPCGKCAPDGHTRMEWHTLGMLCGRCGDHTGNNHQGHYWGICRVTGRVGEMHFCCPGDCALVETDRPIRPECFKGREMDHGDNDGAAGAERGEG